MLKKTILLITTLIGFLGNLYADVFNVVNNNDSGIGSFRDAITKSNDNGNGELDYIYFNIPGNSVEARTISLITGLPDIRTDLIIDASSQTGDLASINGAKIVIEGSRFSDNVSSRIFSVSGVNKFELYGIVIKNFYKDNIRYKTGTAVLIFANANQNITIGAIGKGNVFYNCGFISASPAPTSPISIENFVFKNNFYGIAEDGIGITNVLPSKLYLFGVSNAILGGNTRAEGNLLYGGFEISPTSYLNVVPKPFSIIVKNNIISANINEERPNITIPKNTVYSTINSSSTSLRAEKAKIDVSENVFGSTLTISGFRDADALITSNFFGSSRDLSKKLPISLHAIYFLNFKGKALVGGATVAQGNVITNTNDEASSYPGAVWAEYSEKIELSHNSFFCNPEFPFLYSQTGPFQKPLEVFLDNLSSTSVSGRSKPGARIELFYSDPECTNCQPKRYFASVFTDQNGNWIYNGSLESGFTVLAGASLDGISSEFSDPRIYLMNVGQTFKITHQTCDSPNGKLEGILLVNVNRIEWLDEAGNIMGTDKELTNVKAGKYRIKAYQFGCVVFSDWVIVEDQRPKLAFTGLPNIIHSSCGNMGSVLNLFPNYSKDFSWLDKDGKVVGKERELKNVPAGSYTLHIIGLTDCTKDFGPYEIKKVLGATVDLSKVTLANTSCLSNTGSIRGIVVNGPNVTYKWTNELGATVGSDIDLENIGIGSYRLEIGNETCPPIFSEWYIIGLTNSLTIDDANLKFGISACDKPTGYLTGISVTGASSYHWVDITGNVISPDLNLTEVGPGNYKLVALNNDGCSVESRFYTVGKATPRVFPSYEIDITDPTCDLNNGTASIQFTGQIRPNAIKWLNSNNTIIATSESQFNLPQDTYRIYFTDENGCETLFKTIKLNSIPPLRIATNLINVTPDQCNQSMGSITNILVTGGKVPYQFTWKNSSGQEIGKEPSATRLASGQYYLSITDQTLCEPKILEFNLQNNNVNIETPIIDPIKICSPNIINIQVKNTMTDGIYKLYSSSSATLPIMQQASGNLRLNYTLGSEYFITCSIGACESPKVPIDIQVSGSDLKIPSSFSPNNDGINDLWQIDGLQKYNKPTTKIYNRAGSKVFESQSPTMNFDGKYKGLILPSGTYYYTISLAQNCQMISGSLFIVY